VAGRLQNRVALVTGASQGIGEAIARRFVGEGALVVGVARNRDALAALGAELPGFGGFPADVRDHDALARCVENTIARHGRIDILVNNAGIASYERFTEAGLERWRHTLGVNLEAQFVLCRLVVPHMIRHGYGRIVNISSTQSIATEPGVGAYAASKGGINALTRSLAVELAEHGIVANALLPGCIRTPMSVVDGVDETTTEAFQEWYVKRRKIPLGRAGDAREVAAAALFLASEECSYMTGQTMVVDGGLTITI
jgi:NAD(P)-dependent dehydrogenase (short-subunit alcohol dehydrogenase family)